MHALEDREVTLEEAITRYIDITRGAEKQFDGIIDSCNRDFCAVEALYQDTLEKLNQQKEDMKNKHDSMVELYLKQRYDLQLLQREHDENDGTLTALREEKEELSAKLRDFVHKRRESREALVSNVDRATTQRILPYRKGCTMYSNQALEIGLI